MRPGRGGHPDIEVQAVLVHLSVGVPHLAALEAGERRVHELVAGVGVGVGLVHPRPPALGLGGAETPLPYRRLAEGDAQEGGDVASVRHRHADASDSTGARLNSEVRLALGGAGGGEKGQEEDLGQEEEEDGGLHDGTRKRSLWS